MAEQPTYSYGDQYKTAKDLTKDQQKLAEAASQSEINAPTFDSNPNLNIVNEAMNYGGYEYFAGAAAKELGLKYALPRVAAAGATTMTYAPHFAAFGGGYQLGKELDKEYKISDKIGNYFGPVVARAHGYDTNTGAFTQEELNAERARQERARQPKPTYSYGDQYKIKPADMGVVPPVTPPYDSRPADMGVGPVINAPVVPAEEKGIGMGMGTGDQPYVFNMGDGEFDKGKSSDLQTNMDETSALTDRLSAETFNTPMTGMRPIDPVTGEPLSQRVIGIRDRIGLPDVQASVPMAPQAPKTERELAIAAGEARLQAIRDGAPLSDDAKIASGQMQAPEGYNDRPQPKPEAPTEAPITKGEELQASFELYRDSGKEITPDQIAQAEDIAGAAGRTFNPETGYSPEFSQEIQDQYNEDQRAAEARFNPPEPEPTPLTDQEKEDQALIDNARENGRSEEYIDEMMEAVRERRAEAEESEPPDPSKVKAIYAMMEGQGVTQDPVTGELIVDSEGFLGFDSTKPLERGSALYQQLEQTKEGRYILNVLPPDIRSMENDEGLEEGGVFEADDGRLFQYSNGSFTLYRY